MLPRTNTMSVWAGSDTACWCSKLSYMISMYSYINTMYASIDIMYLTLVNNFVHQYNELFYGAMYKVHWLMYPYIQIIYPKLLLFGCQRWHRIIHVLSQLWVVICSLVIVFYLYLTTELEQSLSGREDLNRLFGVALYPIGQCLAYSVPSLHWSMSDLH